MKAILTCLLVLCLAYGTRAEVRDSVIVQFGNKSKIIIYTQNKADFEKIQRYDLNALLRDIGIKVDSISPNETRLIVAEANGQLYLRDSLKQNASDGRKEYVRIGIRGIHVKDGNDEVHIDWSGIHVKDGNEEINIGRTDTSRYTNRQANRWATTKGIYVHLGLDNYLGRNGADPAGNADYDLRPFGSRHFTVGFVQSAHLARGRNSAFNMGLGVELSWYNFMFDGNNVATKDDPVAGQINFPLAAQELRKSKLTAMYIDLPVMPTVSFRQGFFSFISAGGYVGYRLDSYTKIKRADRTKDHNHGNYYMTDFRYGLRAEVGIRRFLSFFFNYDLNPLYVAGKGPDLRAISFGLRL